MINNKPERLGHNFGPPCIKYYEYQKQFEMSFWRGPENSEYDLSQK